MTAAADRRTRWGIAVALGVLALGHFATAVAIAARAVGA